MALLWELFADRSEFDNIAWYNPKSGSLLLIFVGTRERAKKFRGLCCVERL